MAIIKCRVGFYIRLQVMDVTILSAKNDGAIGKKLWGGCSLCPDPGVFRVDIVLAWLVELHGVPSLHLGRDS